MREKEKALGIIIKDPDSLHKFIIDYNYAITNLGERDTVKIHEAWRRIPSDYAQRLRFNYGVTREFIEKSRWPDLMAKLLEFKKELVDYAERDKLAKGHHLDFSSETITDTLRPEAYKADVAAVQILKRPDHESDTLSDLADKFEKLRLSNIQLEKELNHQKEENQQNKNRLYELTSMALNLAPRKLQRQGQVNNMSYAGKDPYDSESESSDVGSHLKHILAIRKDGTTVVCYGCASLIHTALKCGKLQDLYDLGICFCKKFDDITYYLGNKEEVQAGTARVLPSDAIRIHRSSGKLVAYILAWCEFWHQKGSTEPFVQRYIEWKRSNPDYKVDVSLATNKTTWEEPEQSKTWGVNTITLSRSAPSEVINKAGSNNQIILSHQGRSLVVNNNETKRTRFEGATVMDVDLDELQAPEPGTIFNFTGVPTIPPENTTTTKDPITTKTIAKNPKTDQKQTNRTSKPTPSSAEDRIVSQWMDMPVKIPTRDLLTIAPEFGEKARLAVAAVLRGHEVVHVDFVIPPDMKDPVEAASKKRSANTVSFANEIDALDVFLTGPAKQRSDRSQLTWFLVHTTALFLLSNMKTPTTKLSPTCTPAVLLP